MSLYPDFCWWQGVVENRKDPDKLGRYQVRIFGYHTRDKTQLPTVELPWAVPMQPISSAAMSGVGTSPTGLVEGSTVMGFFADGSDAQIPVIMGSWGCMSMVPEDQNENPIDIDKEKVGFYDPRSNDEANADPQPLGRQLGAYPRRVGEDDEDTGYNKLKEPDSSRLARGGAVAETHASLVAKRDSRIREGIAGEEDDDDREYKGIPMANAPRMTVYDTDDVPEQALAHPKMDKTPDPIYEETFWEEPHPQGSETSQSVYPFNHVRETESGHVFEVDDTPGAERIHTYHRTGTYDEIVADGSRNVKVVGKNYEIIMNDKNLYIKGDFNVTVDGDYKLNVLGNKYEDILGHSFTSVRGNRVTKVQGNSTTEILTDEANITVGNRYDTVQCNQGTGQSVKRVGGKYSKSIAGRSKVFYGLGETVTCMGEYVINTFPTFAMEIIDGALVPALTYGNFVVTTLGDITLGTASPPNFSGTFPTISLQSPYINTKAMLGHIETVGLTPAPPFAPGTPKGKYTQIDIVGLEENVLVGYIKRTAVVGPIIDLAVAGAISYTATAGAATFSAVAGAVTVNAGAAITNTAGAAITNTAGAAFTVNATGAVGVTSGATTTVTSSGNISMTAPIINLN